MIAKFNVLKTITVLLLLLLTVNVHAQIGRQNRSNIVVWGSTGFNSLPNDAVLQRVPEFIEFPNETMDVRTLGGIGAGFGIGYEWHGNNRFIIHTGVEFNLHNSRMALDDFTAYFWMLDSDNPAEYYLGFFEYSDIRDSYRISYLNIPLMFGYQWNRFYFLAGAKFGFNLQGQSRVSTHLETAGLYEYAFEPLRNIPGRFYARQINENSNPVNFGFNTTASLELGFYLGGQNRNNNSNNNVRYRLAVFADYGLLNINTHSPKGDFLLFEPYVSYRPVMNSFVRSDVFNNRHLNTFYVGIKFTAVFGIRERLPCLWERCN